MIKSCVVKSVTLEYKEDRKTLQGVFLSASVAYDLLNEEGLLVGASGTSRYLSAESIDLVNKLMESLKRDLDENLFGGGSREVSKKEKRTFVPLPKEE